MNATLEERKKKAAEKAEDEWNKEQEEKRKMEEKERKLAEIKNAKLDLAKPKKTGWSILGELFDAVVGEEESSSVQWAVMSADFLGIFRAVKSGIIASFTGMPIPKEFKVAPLSGNIRDELMDFVTKYPRKNGENDFISLYGSPYIVGGCLNRTEILKIKFSLPVNQIPVFKIRSDEFDRIFKDPDFYAGFPCGVVDLASLVKKVIADDKQFSYRLSVSHYYAKPIYSLTTPLVRFSFPSRELEANRSRDQSIVLKKPFECRSQEILLDIGKTSEQCRIAGKLEWAIQQKWEDLKELFDYWKLLDKELEKLDSLYLAARKE